MWEVFGRRFLEERPVVPGPVKVLPNRMLQNGTGSVTRRYYFSQRKESQSGSVAATRSISSVGAIACYPQTP